MYNGVAAMIKEELALSGASAASPEAIHKYLTDLSLLGGKGLDDSLTGEEVTSICSKIETVEIWSGLAGEVAKGEDGSSSVKAICEALSKH